MGLYRLALGLFLLPLTLSDSGCLPDLGICLRPLIDTWEHIRNIENHAGDLIFPLPLYRRNSTLALCEQYETIRRKCFPKDCGASTMISFVKQQLGYFCGPLLPLYMKKHECTYSVLLRERQCLRHLHGMPNPLVGSVRCNSFVDFFNCIEEFLDKKCGKEAILLFGGAIRAFGCNMDTGYFEQNRPANYSELITSAEMGSTTASLELRDMETTIEKSKEIDEDVTVTTTGQNSTVVEEASTESDETTTTEDLILSRSVTGDNLTSRDQKLNNSLEEATTLNDNVRMTEKGNEKAEEESVKDAEITSTVANDQDYLPTTSRKGAILSEVEIESTPTPEDPTVMNMTEQTTQMGTEETAVTDVPCSQEDEDYVTACHSLLLRRLSNLSPKDSIAQLRFPLAGTPLQEVQHLCKRYEEGNKCAAEQLERCNSLQILKLINTQLEAVCFRIESMPKDYQCILDTYKENTKCQVPIKGILTDEQDPCTGQQDTFDCFTSTFTCSKNSLILLREMIRGYGCRVDLKRWLTQPPPTTTERMTTIPANVSEPVEVSSTTIASTEKKTKRRDKKEGKGKRPKKYLEVTTFSPPLLTAEPSTELMIESSLPSTFTSIERATTPAPWFGTCSPANRKIARMCMGPLLRTWDGLRRRRMPLRKSHFPIYRYTKTELLELCDGYANSFLCAGHDTIRYCLNDELVSFAQGHLGYQCSPQNLQRFLSHYDCIIQAEETADCRDSAQGEALPGSKRAPTCSSLTAYANCMTPLVEKQCQKEGAMEFTRSIQQFGCKDATRF